jgi:acetoin utilization protein AcuC
MAGKTTFVYREEYQDYCLSLEHPFSPLRWELTWDLVKAMGLLENTPQHRPQSAPEEALELVHTSDYIQAVRDFGCAMAEGEHVGPPNRLMQYGLAGDTPAFPDMHEAAALHVGGTLEAGKLVLRGDATHVVNVGGGLHHAMPGKASGFCVYNDLAVLIAHLRELGLRVAYVDIDAHHGDGVQQAFYSDPAVLTVSIHESGDYLFPGTGYEDELGKGEAEGTNRNFPLPPTAGDDEFLELVEGQLPALIEDFSPDFLVTQHGCDGHKRDPLTHLNYTMRSFLRAAAQLHQLAHEYAAGNWVAAGGGGYDLWSVVPRAWAALCAAAAHVPVGPDTEVPEAFREKWSSKANTRLPETFGEE